MKTIQIPPVGAHPAKSASEFKIGEIIIMAHRSEYKIINISKSDAHLEFTIECRFGRKSKLIKHPTALLAFKSAHTVLPKRKAYF